MITRTSRLVIVAIVLGSAFTLVALASAAHGSAKPPKSGKYAGMASENVAVTFTVTAGGKKVTSFASALGYNGKCGQGGGPGFIFKVASMPIKAGGHFSGTAQGVAGTAKATIQVTGVISNRSAHGSIAELKPFLCKAPHKGVNPYIETFTASTK